MLARFKITTYLALILLLLSGCSSTAVRAPVPVAKTDALDRASIVTMGNPKLDPGKPSTVSWAGKVEIIGNVSDDERRRMQALVTGLCEGAIGQKGYPFISSDGDFQLSATLVFEPKEGSDPLLLDKAGIDPGIAGTSTAGAKGSLVLELKQGKTTRWKGAVQIYTDPSLSQDLREQRAAHAVAQLISTWP